ncbi:capsule biosynthesis GfcC D2 domain-containing protein [Planctobacterium marinum]|uniref:capsule biosynthesis GfcC D2 domain-containing protein n=1 Tax=Planctobacterium marinum TaxID=1631968 RepID=UPI001E5E6E17|nr:capsule biosynthesis GfcC D2 domain-containing protein [Planctobacterium marinum]MCC2606403.1 capsule biosynthesis GfcC family protein [Planctobacterium marinum]
MRVILASLCVLSLFQVNAEVRIDYLSNQLVYDSNPRIETVLKGVVKNRDIFWPAAVLYNRSAVQELGLKQQCLQMINDLKSETGVKTAKYQALNSLLSQIDGWNLAHRVPLLIDYDFARVREELNPRVDDGDYLLHLPARSNQVQVFGAVPAVLTLNHIGAAPVQSYLEKFERLDYADNEFVYVIKLDGTYERVSTGVHSMQRVEVPPGGSIYIPLRELPFSSENTILNEMVAELAGSRLP